MACGNPADAYTMIQQSISCDDPVIFFEPKRRYWDKAEVDTAGGAADALPLSRPGPWPSGTDVTVLALRPDGQDAARRPPWRRRADGRSLEVIDLRSLAPLDTGPIFARCGGPAGAWSCTRHRSPAASAPR